MTDKLFSLALIFLLTFLGVQAQTPQRLSYQVVLRDNGNQLLANRAIRMRVSILSDSSNGTAAYSETHTATTSAQVVVQLSTGGGTVTTGSFATIPWRTGRLFVRVETDPTGGTNYSLSATTQLLSVPYATYSADIPVSKSGDTIQVGNARLMIPGAVLIPQSAGLPGTIQVTTNSIDLTTSPIKIGGTVASGGSPNIIEKGIVMGRDSTQLRASSTYSNFIYYPTSVISTQAGGWWTPANTTITVRSKPGLGTFSMDIQGAYGSTLYFVRAYAKTPDSIFYGNTIRFTTGPFKRETASLDVANVFYKTQFDLFDLTTDEVITPDANGNYTYWYSSNEDPRVFLTTKSRLATANHLFYHFKNEASCKTWTDYRTGRVVPVD
jgi:hypothetical protein